MRKGAGPVWTLVKIIVILICIVAVFRSNKIDDYIQVLPFANPLLELLSKGTIIVSQKGNYQILTETYRDVMISMMSGVISAILMHLPGVSLIVYGPKKSDSDSAFELTESDRTPGTVIRYFFIGVLMTMIASFAFDWLVPQGGITRWIHLPYMTAVLIFTAVVVALCVIKNMLGHMGQKRKSTFFLIPSGHLPVGIVGFTIYSILKDALTTALNSGILILLYLVMRDPAASSGLIMIILLLVGIEYMIGAVFA